MTNQTKPDSAAPDSDEKMLAEIGFICREGPYTGSYMECVRAAYDDAAKYRSTSAAPGGDVEQRARELLAQARREYRDSDAAGDVLDWLDEKFAALSAPKLVGAVPIDGIIDANFAEDGSTTNWLPWRVLRDDDGALWLTTDDPERDIEIDQESDDE